MSEQLTNKVSQWYEINQEKVSKDLKPALAKMNKAKAAYDAARAEFQEKAESLIPNQPEDSAVQWSYRFGKVSFGFVKATTPKAQTNRVSI